MAKPRKNVEVAAADVAPVVAEDNQPTSIECDEVELGYTRDQYEAIKLASENFGTYIAKFISPKYPKMKICEVHKEHVAQQYRGWVPLKLDNATHTVSPAKSLDEACKRTDTVLCWKTQARWEAERQLWKDTQNKMNKFVAGESSDTMTEKLNNDIDKIGRGQISARPLAARESDE